MRIIAGDFKGRRLYTPENYNIRPTTDKVKEAMFSIIMPYISESICVDLFSGTGNLGLEAISRGASKCYFCDNSRESIQIIKKNIDYCKAGDKSVIKSGDFRKVLESMREKVDIFFMDPPYEAGYYSDAFEKIAERGLLSDDGIIIAEHRDSLELPDALMGFERKKIWSDCSEHLRMIRLSTLTKTQKCPQKI